MIRLTSIVLLTLLSVWGCSDNPEELWGKKYDEIVNAACQNVSKKCHVQFSAYEEDWSGLPSNNLEEIAIKGKVVVLQRDDEFLGKGSGFESELYVNPTWQDLTEIANNQIIVTGDYHHIYLEGYEVTRINNGIKYVELYMGS